MKISKKTIFAFFCAALAALPATVKAVCPVCIVAVGAGLGLSRWLGIDDTITGLWLGGLTIAVTVWTKNWLNKKNVRLPLLSLWLALVYYGSALTPLYVKNLLGHPLNALWSVDKLIMGMAIGTILFYVAELFYEFLKKRNDGRAHFPFEKIVLPMAALLVASAIFYFLTK